MPFPLHHLFLFPFLVFSVQCFAFYCCEFGNCSRWHILLVPLLSDRFVQLPLLKGIVHSMLSGCRWYLHDQIQLQFLTKNGTFVPLSDPILLPTLDKMRQSRLGQWKSIVELAVENMNGTKWVMNDGKKGIGGDPPEEGDQIGRYIFVVTDFERRGHNDDEFVEELNRMLARTRIHFRNVRLQFDGMRETKIVPPRGGEVGGDDHVHETVANVSSNFVRVALIEQRQQQNGMADAFDVIRPCPQLTNAERIREYSYVQHFYYRNWFLRSECFFPCFKYNPFFLNELVMLTT
uniref:Uncharacterized protein n=1 Tax=Globodera rostochiensis TaxID=31243 RepID=A0A914GWD6_GLORO